MLVLLFKNVRNFVSADVIFKALDEQKFSKKEYEKIKKDIEKVPNLERLI